MRQIADQWTVPIKLAVSQVFKVGDQAMGFQVGGKYYAEAPQGAPDWDIRTTLPFALSQEMTEVGMPLLPPRSHHYRGTTRHDVRFGRIGRSWVQCFVFRF
jgi:hypothetical protein